MLLRFSLYGFLKNQQYYEPFIILALLEAPMSFLQIGILIAFREICINIFEVPSGAIADIWGRRRSMILSFAAYIISFVIFGGAHTYGLFFAAMFFFAVGESFRTGTHKAMIFDWLDQQGRMDEKTRIYGFTRSWSKIGSAVSVLIAALLVFVSGSYRHIFYYSIPVYVLGIINFLGYPANLDGRKVEDTGETFFKKMQNLLFRSVKSAALGRELRGLLGEAMLFDGTFRVIKDYLQPILKAAALGLPFFLAWSGQKRTALVAGGVYFILHILSSIASRKSHKFVKRAGGEKRAALLLWAMVFICYGGLAYTLWRGWIIAAIAIFIILYIVHNYWRPTFESRMSSHAGGDSLATVLSIENQVRALATMIIAPFLGYIIDSLKKPDSEALTLWPLGVFGLAIALAGFLVCRLVYPRSRGGSRTAPTGQSGDWRSRGKEC